jgi:UDPglucose 6-dehydrogenase
MRRRLSDEPIFDGELGWMMRMVTRMNGTGSVDIFAGSADIVVVGCGYVGLVTAVGLAEQGHRVRAYDVDPVRVAASRELRFPMVEPGLEEAARAAGNGLTFHDAREEAWPGAAFTFLAVPTPQGEAGYPNLTFLRRALMWIADSRGRAGADSVIVVRSTVPPGTARWARGEIERLIGSEVPVLANPEFLQEGRALEDFRHPSRIVIGSEDGEAADRLAALMAFAGAPVVITDTATAELAKYGSNAFLAVRVSFANELARLAEREGADPLVMLEAVGLDPRIGSRYLKPGIGYGGSCLPKDVAALISMGTTADEPMSLIGAAQEVNELQRRRAIRALVEGLGGVSGRRIAVLGLAFKPGTNDIRESPGLHVVRELSLAGAHPEAWDPAVGTEQLPEDMRDLAVHRDILEALSGVDAAVVATEWPEVMELDLVAAARAMRGDLIVDGRYALDRARAAEAGLDLVRLGARRAFPVRPIAEPATAHG